MSDPQLPEIAPASSATPSVPPWLDTPAGYLAQSLALVGAYFIAKWTPFYSTLRAAGAYHRLAPVSFAWIGLNLLSFAVLLVLAFTAIWVARRLRLFSAQTLLTATAVFAISIAVARLSERYYLAPVLAVALALLARALPSSVAAVADKVVVAFLVLLAIQALQLGYLAAMAPSRQQLENYTLAPLKPGTANKPHIVWMLFDEFDEELSTTLRPASIPMPQYDRLRSEAWVAGDAHSATNYTLSSIAAMTIGKSLYQPVQEKGTSYGDVRTLYIQFTEGSDPVSWTAQPTVFSEARRLGLNSAITGWYHPYCRMFPELISACWWTPAVHATHSLRHEHTIKTLGLAQSIKPRSLLLGNMPYPEDFEVELAGRDLARAYPEMLAKSLEFAANRDLNLVLSHWMIPHYPALVTRKNLPLAGDPSANYLDNFVLVDRTIGEFRALLEAQGTWNETILIVTSDHYVRPWLHSSAPGEEFHDLAARRKHPRIPFIVKLPGGGPAARFDQPVSNIVLHDLILRWMNGTRDTYETLSAFAASQRSKFPVHADQPAQ